MKTKRRNPKRFEFKEVEANIILLNCADSPYLKTVDAKVLGAFGIHTLWEGFYCVFHVPTNLFVCAFKEEKKAKTFVKKLYCRISDATYSLGEIAKRIVSLIDKMEGIDITIDSTSTYNSDEDIPF